MAPNPEVPEWLANLWWREAWLTLEAAEPASLPPYPGSALRGALGHLMRAALCDGSGCGHECQRPEACRYYSLFEQDSNGAKPFLLLAPAPPGLEEIAMGGPVNLPYRTGAPRGKETVPTLRNEAAWKLGAGATLTFGLRLFGSASNAVAGVIQAVSQCGLAVSAARFRLLSARDASGQMLYDIRLPGVPVQTPAARSLRIEREAAKRLRIVFLSPALLKLGAASTFSPEDFAARFFEHCIGRTVRMHRVCSGMRAPWVEAPAPQTQLANHRLFHFELPRQSYRQDKWLDFDGMVGYFDLAGGAGPALPWARAAEVLHFGQKSAFGLGKMRVLILE
jgi:hypothetical protein